MQLYTGPQMNTEWSLQILVYDYSPIDFYAGHGIDGVWSLLIPACCLNPLIVTLLGVHSIDRLGAYLCTMYLRCIYVSERIGTVASLNMVYVHGTASCSFPFIHASLQIPFNGFLKGRYMHRHCNLIPCEAFPQPSLPQHSAGNVSVRSALRGDVTCFFNRGVTGPPVPPQTSGNLTARVASPVRRFVSH
jgi:hypothetical protein